MLHVSWGDDARGERGPDGTGLHALDQGFCVDDWAARDVDQEGAILHPTEKIGRDEVVGLLSTVERSHLLPCPGRARRWSLNLQAERTGSAAVSG